MIDLILATIWQILWGDHGIGFWPILVMIVVWAIWADKET